MLLLTLEGLSWAAVRKAIASGVAPGLKALLETSAAFPMTTSIPVDSPAIWASLATGTSPTGHGITHAQEEWAGGLRATTRESWRLPPLWQILSDEGCSTGSIFYPWTRPGAAWDGMHVDDRMLEVSGLGWDDWPLPLDVAPSTIREEVRNVRVHPAELSPELLARFPESSRHSPQGLATALARCTTGFAVAQTVLRRAELDFVAAHLDWLQVFAAALSLTPDDALPAPAWALLDAAVSGFRGLIGPQSMMIIASPGVPGRSGFVAVTGEGAAAWRGAPGVSILDIAPTILSHFGMVADLPGRSMLSTSARPITPRPLHEFKPGADESAMARVVEFGHSIPSVPGWWPVPKLLAEAQLILDTDLSAARSLVEEALQRWPDHPFGLSLSGLIAFAQEDAGALSGFADRLAVVAPGHLWEAMLRAGYHVLRREASKATPLLRRVEAEGGTDDLLRVAGAWLMLGRRREAGQVFERILQLQPNQIPALLGLASTKLDQPFDAEQILRRVLSVDPQHPQAREALVEILISLGRREEAQLIAAREQRGHEVTG